jgi:serine O-acetyltransferase
VNAARLWQLSTRLHRRGMRRSARLIKTLIYLIDGALLEPEVELQGPVYFAHRGTGIVVHGSTVIEPEVVIWQHALIASNNDKETTDVESGVRIRSEAVIGARAIIMCPHGRTLTIGRGARIAAGAIVTSDVPDGAVVLPETSKVARINPPELWPLP